MTLSAQIKQFIAKQFGIKARVQTGVSKNPFICAWQPSEPRHKVGDALVYTQPPFPLEFRQKCLGAIYGVDDALAKTTNDSCGNVNTRSISMHGREWEAVMAQYKCAIPDCENRATDSASVSINNEPKKEVPVCKIHLEGAAEDVDTAV